MKFVFLQVRPGVRVLCWQREEGALFTGVFAVYGRRPYLSYLYDELYAWGIDLMVFGKWFQWRGARIYRSPQEAREHVYMLRSKRFRRNTDG